MSLTQMYAADVFESLEFYKKKKHPIKFNFPSGESLIHNIFNLSLPTNRITLTNYGVGIDIKQSSVVFKDNVIESIETGHFAERSSLPESKRVIYMKDMPERPELTSDLFATCQQAADSSQCIAVRTVSGKEYVGSISGIKRYAVGLFDVDGVEGKVNVFFDWVTDIRVV